MIKNKKLLWYIMLCFTCTFQSCMVHKLKVNKSKKNFYGIKKFLSENDQIDVFVTHGMGINNMNFADDLVKGIVEKEGFNLLKDTTHHLIYSKRRVITYRKGSKQLRFTVHGWYPATGLKFILHFMDVIPDRLETMDQFKASLMNQSVSDVIMYQGNFRDIIRREMKNTLQSMVNEEGSIPIVGITESLGSKIFIETINKSINDGEVWAKKWKQSITSIYMLSNQLPLLYMGDLSVSENVDKEGVAFDRKNKAMRDKLIQNIYNPLKQFTQSLNGDKKYKPQLIAISDPNDLLSYPVPEDVFYTSAYNVNNVFVSIAAKGYSWPFGKPKIVNPIKAHLNYQKNPLVINYILNGSINK
ncbi:hypothetical protein SAMN04489761_4534 [Tenacibaculum sp. MAR_2009_124]|uniref:hypothetical protein n=1 Tax=Tenacibaculum sp. MAR_2009_124 TaxID=1250059 RepID=UPI00089B2CC6|nr:hypothetical protein [Tenacibaculum sp. MAR_2009_124]SED18051.1 hypothetical protein SAMN04489761_4534 [Tenacibaculum sp. MAR_2009_124]